MNTREEYQAINRNTLLKGIASLLYKKRLRKINEITKTASDDAELDERVLVLRALIEIHPSLKDYLIQCIIEIKREYESKAQMDVESAYVSNSEEEIIKAKLELMTDDQLRNYTLEKLLEITYGTEEN